MRSRALESYAVALAFVVVTLAACIPAVVKSAYDIGVELCELYYQKHPEHNFSPQDVCKIAEVVQPFVDHASRSEAEAGERSHAALAARRPSP